MWASPPTDEQRGCGGSTSLLPALRATSLTEGGRTEGYGFRASDVGHWLGMTGYKGRTGSSAPTEQRKGCGGETAGRCTPRVLVPLRSTAWASPPTEGLSRVRAYNGRRRVVTPPYESSIMGVAAGAGFSLFLCRVLTGMVYCMMELYENEDGSYGIHSGRGV